MSDLPEFAHLLRIHLERNGRSPNWLAQQLQLNPEIVTAWLEGDHPRNREIIIRIVGLLSIADPEEGAFLHAAGYVSPTQSPTRNEANFYGPVYGPVHTGSGNVYVSLLSPTRLKERRS